MPCLDPHGVPIPATDHHFAGEIVDGQPRASSRRDRLIGLRRPPGGRSLCPRRRRAQRRDQGGCYQEHPSWLLTGPNGVNFHLPTYLISAGNPPAPISCSAFSPTAHLSRPLVFPAKALKPQIAL